MELWPSAVGSIHSALSSGVILTRILPLAPILSLSADGLFTLRNCRHRGTQNSQRQDMTEVITALIPQPTSAAKVKRLPSSNASSRRCHG